jgi:hypothetical protein
LNDDCKKLSEASHCSGVACFPPWDITKNLLFKAWLSSLRPSAQEELNAMKQDLQDALVIHLRGGDVISRKKDFLYFPAPCAYFNHVVNNGNNGKAFREVVIIGESANHPCLEYLKNLNVDKNFKYNGGDSAKDIKKDSGTLIQDWMTLMAAKNLALSVSSTFGLAGMMMNVNNETNVFLPVFSPGRPDILAKTDGYYEARQLNELCAMGSGSQVFEIPNEHIWSHQKQRQKYMLQDQFFDGFVHHKCQ